jgi:two-component system response regulator NreC
LADSTERSLTVAALLGKRNRLPCGRGSVRRASASVVRYAGASFFNGWVIIVAISILLADDHALVRRGMQALFDGVPDFSVVGTAADGLEAVRLAERLKPDVLVVDLMMPGLGGLEALRIVRDRLPRTRTVVISLHSSNAFIAQALQNGAMGFVLKGCSEENLVRAVKEAAAGRRFLSPLVTEAGINAYIERSTTGAFDPHETLTPRQREVLQMAAEGKTNAEIAARLKISPRTVENHRASSMEKLGLRNQIDLIRHAIRYGLIPPEE